MNRQLLTQELGLLNRHSGGDERFCEVGAAPKKNDGHFFVLFTEGNHLTKMPRALCGIKNPMKKLNRHCPPFLSHPQSEMNTTEILYILSQMKTQLSQLFDQISHIEAMHGKEPTVPEEDVTKKRSRPRKGKLSKEAKPPHELSEALKVWLKFNKYIATIFKDTEYAFKRVTVAKKFASYLKKIKSPDQWTEEEIRMHRASWPDDSVETNVTALSETDMSSVEGTVKKAGRPKMTDEEKAAAKAAREVKKSEEAATPIKKSSKLGSAPGAPKKGLKVAWEETAEVARNLMKEADELLSE